MFSELQLTLAGVGATFLVALYGYNRWQEARLRRRTEAAFPKIQNDVLEPTDYGVTAMRSQDVTPTDSNRVIAPGGSDPVIVHDLGVSAAANTTNATQNSSDAPAQPATVQPIEHTLGLPPIVAEVSRGVVAPSVPDIAPMPNPMSQGGVPLEVIPSTETGLSGHRANPLTDVGGGVLDPRLDYAATLRFADPQTGEAILRIGAELRAAKPVHWEGYDGARRCWADLVPDALYSEVRVGLQLVDRGGIASDDDVIEFCRGVQSLAATFVATTDFPSRSVALRAAAQLDRLCAEVDIQIGMNVVKTDGAPIPGTKVRALAESLGCAFRDDGRFVHLSADGADLLTITNLEPTPFRADTLTSTATRAVALTLDVPRAPDADATYRQFVEAAQRIARALEGELVDDHRLPIPPAAMDAIGNAVAKARATMRESSIPAGSRLARRLFA